MPLRSFISVSQSPIRWTNIHFLLAFPSSIFSQLPLRNIKVGANSFREEPKSNVTELEVLRERGCMHYFVIPKVDLIAISNSPWQMGMDERGCYLEEPPYRGSFDFWDGFIGHPRMSTLRFLLDMFWGGLPSTIPFFLRWTSKLTMLRKLDLSRQGFLSLGLLNQWGPIP